MAKQEIKKSVCEFCHARCRLLVYSENGHLVKLEPDPSDPLVNQIWPPIKACVRMMGTKEWMYHPDHVNYPLKRAGERGEGKWQRISWEQAFDEISDKMKEIINKYGPEAIAGTVGTQRTQEEFVGRFYACLGTPNWGGQSEICYSPCVTTLQAMYGWPARHRSTATTSLDAKEEMASKQVITKCMLVIGIAANKSTLRLWKIMRDCKKAGGKIIVVDPRRIETAELADLFIQLRPGTDAALLLSMINVIIEEELYDKEFVEKWCYGFNELAERARQYPPEKAAEICWLTPEIIREAARMYATNKPALAMHGMGEEHIANAIDAIQARAILPAITGNLDISGGNIIPGPARNFIDVAEMSLFEKLSPEQRAKQLGRDRFKLIGFPGWEIIQSYTEKMWGVKCSQPRNDASAHLPTILRAMLTGKPYPVRACFTAASNPMVTQPNTKLVYKALKSLDLYVVADFFITPSAAIADYVLPVASWLERPFIYSLGNGFDNCIRAGEQALPASISGEYDHKTDYEIFREISIRLGLGEYWPWKTLEESYDYRLTPRGLTFKQFMEQGGYDFPVTEGKKHEKMGGFATATGKVELSSTVLEKLGYDPLPQYYEAAESPVSTPELAKEYPFILNTGGRFTPMFHSEHFQISTARKKHPHPLVQINPKTAKELNIEDGDWVWIETKRGRCRMKCKYFEGTDSRVIHAEHGWWFPELPGEEPWLHGVWESNINVCTDDDPDVCGKKHGGWPLKSGMCKVYKAKSY